MGLLYSKPTFLPPGRDDDGALTYFGGAFKTWAISNDKESFTSRQIFAPKNPHTGNGRASTATPPYHWHLLQDETFDVKSGVLEYIIDGQVGQLKAGEKRTSRRRERHTFYSASDEALDVYITVRGGDNAGFDETFVRNFYGYLSSQTMQGLKPNPFQMLLFMYSADVVLVDVPGGKWANLILGKWIGQYLLGMQSEYKEFSPDSE